MIVVVGIPAWRPDPQHADEGSAAGPAVEISRAAVAAGARVELVGKAGEDREGEALLLDLSRAGIGHVALLRDAGRPTLVLPPAPADGARDEPALDADIGPFVALEVDRGEPGRSNGRSPVPSASREGLVLEPADLELALGYLVDFRVLVVAEDVTAPAAAVVTNAASFVGAKLVAVSTGEPASALPADATVFEAPPDDPDGEFGRLVGAYAAALDRGEPADAAFRNATAERGWETAG